MRIMKTKVLLFLAVCAFVACNSSKKEQVSSSEVEETTVQEDSAKKAEEAAAAAKAAEEAAAAEARAIDFIKDMYNKRKFESEAFLKSHCSKDVLKKLRADYEYEDGGLATWDFRSNAQDGPNEKHEVISVIPEGDDWYKYDFYDMGVRGSHKIKVVANGDDFLIDGLK